MKKVNPLTKFRFLIILFVIIFLIQAAYVVVFINSNNIKEIQKDRIITLQVLFVFLELLLGIFVYFYLGKILKYVFNPLSNIFKELEIGKLQISLPYQFEEEPLKELASPLENMLSNLRQFNLEKKNKIKEYKDRLNLIIKSVNAAVLIINEEFQIVYVNEIAKKLLGIISDEDYPSLMDFHFEGEVLKYFKEALSKKVLIPPRKVYFPKIKRHITFNNGIVHDTEGTFKGMVFTITKIDLEELEGKSKQNKNPDKE